MNEETITTTPAEAPATAPAETPATNIVQNMLQSGMSAEDLKIAFKSALQELDAEKSSIYNKEEIEKAEKEYFGGFLR